MSFKSTSRLVAEVKSPLELGVDEIAIWHTLMDENSHLRRAFFSPEFAQACQLAHGRARVVVLTQGGEIVAFFPFQFSNRWHQALRSAVRIGGDLCDHAGVVAKPGFRISPCQLLDAAGVNDIFIDHLGPAQDDIGLKSGNKKTGHIIDVTGGSENYFEALEKSKASFVRDTKRRLRRAENEYGTLALIWQSAPDMAAINEIVEWKRQQYSRTSVNDVLAKKDNLSFIEALIDHPSPYCRPVVSKLIAGSRVLAQHLSLLCKDVMSAWFPVYDPQAKSVSPGRLLFWLTIQASDERGIKVIDRGAGDSQAKREFSTGINSFGEAIYANRGPQALLARSQRAIAWRLQAATEMPH